MAILATFVGVDRHQDPLITELTGARRDATALWALFCDTLPEDEMRAELLCDEQATHAAVTGALDRTLSQANSEDTVIFFFAGHGSPDHQLVMFDTAIDGLDATTVAMAHLAEKFRSSPAKSVLCVLDCCFSGGAPARCLDNAPAPRSHMNPLESIQGEGRILLSACATNEAAWERNGHGLLTWALMDLLRNAEGPVALLSSLESIMGTVRAEAARMGKEQTPRFFGDISGELTIPCLQPSVRFFQVFPEQKGLRVSGDLAELTGFGIPEAITTEWQERFGAGLNSLQIEAVNEGRVLDGQSLLVVAPTSSGKTFVGELAATKKVLEGRKAAFLFPYRALVNEKFDQFSQLYGEKLGMRIIRCSGDYVDNVAEMTRGRYDMALLTYEMFLNLVANNPTVLAQLGLVVVDEAQFITDPTRGVAVELLFTSLLTARERGVEPQLLALSAVIGDVNDFDAWLGVSKLVSTLRPVPLIEGVIDRTGNYRFVDESGMERSEQLVDRSSIRQRRDKPSAQDIIVPLVQALVQSGEKVIVFRNMRGSAQGCANYLADDLGLPPATAIIEQLPMEDQSRTSQALRKCLSGGTAFHTTNLTREEREVVERAYRDSSGQVRVLAATTTVAAGINTPASTVILAEQEFVGEDGRAFSVAEYKNMAGRAGRLGFNEKGKAILYAETSHQQSELFQRYVRGQLEKLYSSFSPDDLETWVLRLLTQVERVRREEVIGLLSNTYGGYLLGKRNPGWSPQMRNQLENLLQRMVSLDLVEEDEDYVQLSLLGKACGQSALSFRSAIRLIELLKPLPPANVGAEILMLLVQALPDADAMYTPLMKRGNSEAKWQGEAVRRFGSEIVRQLQRLAGDNIVFLARCKRALVLADWVRGKPLEEIETAYTFNPFNPISHGDIRRFADTSRYYLRSAFQIVSVLFLGEGPTQEDVDNLLKAMEVGIPVEATGLLQLPFVLGRGEYLRLLSKGIQNQDAFWGYPQENLGTLLDSTRIKEIERFRPTQPTH